jgi:hypothetical protein
MSDDEDDGPPGTDEVVLTTDFTDTVKVSCFFSNQIVANALLRHSSTAKTS